MRRSLDVRDGDLENPSIEGELVDPEEDMGKADIEKQEKELSDSTNDDPKLVDWDGPDDPECPLNWSMRTKVCNVGAVAAMVFLTPLASSMFAPGAGFLMRDFHSSNTALASFVVSAYVLGFAVGPLFIAPMSELYGRVPVYTVCNFVTLCFNVGCALAPNMGAFIAFRILSGMAGAAPLSLGGGTIADLFVREKRGVAMSLYTLGPMLGPVVGPIAGGFLAESKGWRWDFWVLVILLGVTTVLAILILRESYHPVLLQRKTKRLIQETGDTSLKSKMGTPGSPKLLFWLAIKRPMTMLIYDPIILILSTYIAIVFGYLYLLITTFTLVYSEQYHFSEGIIGLSYIGSGIGSMIAVVVVGGTSDRILIALTKRHGGVPQPEFRLPPMMFLGWTLPVGLFWYGWAAQARVHWIVPMLGTVVFGLGFFATMMPVQTYLVDAYGRYAASALAANTVLRCLVAAFLPLGGQGLYNRLGIGWGNSLLGFVACVFLPFPFLFYRYGGAIRKRFAREY